MTLAEHAMIWCAAVAALYALFGKRIFVFRPLIWIPIAALIDYAGLAISWWSFLLRERLKERRRNKINEFLRLAARRRLTRSRLEDVN